jgi:predicted nuclease of predicted toxin-antitoxin system
MKLFFDHHLFCKLVGRLADLFPNSEHVRNVSLHAADDRVVSEYAPTNGFAIVSKDEDFHQLRFLSGAPPDLLKFNADEEGAFLIVGIRRA